MDAKKRTGSVSNLVYVVIILAIVVVVNVLGNTFFGRIDLTGNKLYSISPTTREILRGLDDVVSVKGYFSQRLPVQVSRLPKEIDDMLKEYRVYSGGNIHYERIDPGDNEELKQQLAQTGVNPVTMTIIEKDERQQINGYLAMTVSYGEKTEAIPLVQSTDDLEYELTSRIYRVTSEPKHVGFLTSGMRHSLTGDYGHVAQEIRKIHEIDQVDLDQNSKVPETINALIVAGPNDSVPEKVKFGIDQFIMRGGNVLFLMDNLIVDQNRQPRLINHGMNGMLLTYGFRLKSDVVRDEKSLSPERVSQGIFTFNQPNPFFPHITKTQFGENPIVSRLSEMTLPWTGSLEVAAPGDSDLSCTVLATTSDAAQSIGPPAYQPSGVPSKLPLILFATGKFQSAFQGRSDLAAAGDSILTRSVKPAGVLVIGSSSFVQSNYLYPGNLEFMLNVIDYLTIGDRLISIRTRPTTDRPLKNLSGEMKNFMRIVNIVGVPIFVILFGAMRFYLKRRDKAVRSRAL